MADPLAAVARDQWTLDPDWAHLNHGSFGATPRVVLEAQSALRARMERQPVLFMRELEWMLDEARAKAAAFVGADADDLAFVRNATEGVNAVLRSLRLDPGDEILVNTHEYNACLNTARFVAERAGAKVVTVDFPLRLRTAEEFTGAVMGKVSGRTRIAMISHITSPTGLVLPVEGLTRELQAHGVLVLIDGAHAPGMLPLDLNALGADFYVGNFHKWVCAPKGAAMLHARRDRQPGISPAVISHGRNAERADRSRFRMEFDWTGTADFTPYLCVPVAIEAIGAMLPGGNNAVMAANRAKVLAARAMLCEALGVEPPVPEPFVGSLSAVPLPEDLFPGESVDGVKRRLEAARVEIPVIARPDCPRLVRLSAHLYNSREDYERLAAALTAGRGGR